MTEPERWYCAEDDIELLEPVCPLCLGHCDPIFPIRP